MLLAAELWQLHEGAELAPLRSHNSAKTCGESLKPIDSLTIQHAMHKVPLICVLGFKVEQVPVVADWGGSGEGPEVLGEGRKDSPVH